MLLEDKYGREAATVAMKVDGGGGCAVVVVVVDVMALRIVVDHWVHSSHCDPYFQIGYFNILIHF